MTLRNANEENAHTMPLPIAKFNKAMHVLRTEGIRSLIVKTRAFLSAGSNQPAGTQVMRLFAKRNVPEFFSFITTKAQPAISILLDSKNSRKVVWLIPDFGIGSGGHLNIFRFVQSLESQGFECLISIIGAHRHSSTEAARDEIRKHFFPIDAQVVFGTQNIGETKYAFATSWITAYALNAFANCQHKLYFVQDFEPYFYPHGSEYTFAERTYSFGFLGVTAGGWLKQKLELEYQMPCYELGFSYEKELYKPKLRREPEILRVFCYCRPPTARRGLESALIALDIVGKKLPNVKFIFAGWDMSEYAFDHEFLNAGLLSVQELPDLYSQCDVALVMSFTNLSLLPLELMATGCCVVSNNGPNNQWLLNNGNCSLSPADPDSLADAIVLLLTDKEVRRQLSDRALKFAQTTSWEAEGISLAKYLQRLKG